MKRTPKKKGVPSAETIARMADQGKDVSRYFTNRGKMMQPIQRVNVDFPSWMIHSLDKEANRLGVTRQSIIKVWISERLKLQTA